jgi:secondary thiamine-phosphate synthase enzyme
MSIANVLCPSYNSLFIELSPKTIGKIGLCTIFSFISMTVYMGTIQIKTNEMDIVDITHDVRAILEQAGIDNGLACIFCSGSTGAVTTIEHEPGLLQDLPSALERLASRDARYRHEERWHDGNGHSHIRASLIGPSLTVPIIQRALQLGTWQQIVFVECDVRPRNRELLVQVVGE